MTVWEIILRLLLALAIGALIGWERELVNRPAGLRTHMLVSIGAAVVMLIGEAAMYRYLGTATVDPTRLGAQVISGIGFLGAGTIMREGVNVRGLTTAASLWAVACLGLAAGGGYYIAAAAGTVAILLTLTIFDYIEKRFVNLRQKTYRIELECLDLACVMGMLNETAKAHHTSLDRLEVGQKETDGRVHYLVRTDMTFGKAKAAPDYQELLGQIARCDGIVNMRAEEHRPS